MVWMIEPYNPIMHFKIILVSPLFFRDDEKGKTLKGELSMKNREKMNKFAMYRRRVKIDKTAIPAKNSLSMLLSVPPINVVVKDIIGIVNTVFINNP